MIVEALSIAKKKNKIIFLCTSEELTRERRAYSDAFERLGYEIVISEDVLSLEKIIHKIGDSVFLILQPEGYTSIHPIDILNYPIATAIFQWDTYTRTKERAFASLVYDFKFVCHPGFDNIFKMYGCTHAYTLPWCIDKYTATGDTFSETYDIGWVGRSDAAFYKNRRRILEVLKGTNFKMNNTDRHYSWEEMFLVYRSSKIVVNVSRDDFPEDANMRCFEAMGCGALLFTQMPSELTDLGFKEEEHFIGFTTDEELLEKLNYYLSNDQQRAIISNNAKELVINKHSYDERAAQIVNYVIEKGGSAIADNIYRKKEKREKILRIAYCYWKDGDLEKMLYVLSLIKGKVPFSFFLKATILFLRKVKRII